MIRLYCVGGVNEVRMHMGSKKLFDRVGKVGVSETD